MKVIRSLEKRPKTFNSNNTRKVKVFKNFLFLNCCIQEVSQPNFAQVHLRKKIEKLHGDAKHVEHDFNSIENFLFANPQGIKEFVKFSMQLVAYISYPHAAGADIFFRSIELPELWKDLIEKHPEFKFTEYTENFSYYVDAISSSVIGDILRDAIEPCFKDDWLLIDQSFLGILALELPSILDRLNDASTIIFSESNDSKSEFITTLLSLNNQITTSKGGVTAAANRDAREQPLREKAISMFKKNNPKTNKKWKSRNEFYDYFVIVTNNNINDESLWVKTATVKRWITQYLTESNLA